MKTSATLLALFLSVPAAGSAELATIPDQPTRQVAGRTWVIHGPMAQPDRHNRAFINNPAFVITGSGVVIVDPGSSVQIGEMVLRQLKKHTDKPVIAVLNTHVHGDHWLGNDAVRRAYPDVPIFAHPRMIEQVRQGAGERWIELLNRLTGDAVTGTQVVAPTHAIGDGDVLEFGETHFRFHHKGPAHTTTDLMIEVAEEDLLFTGDNANNGRIVRMDDGQFKGNLEALELARSLQRRIVVPGHGETGGNEVIEGYLGYLDTLYRTVGELFEQGLSDFEMKDRVDEQLAAYRDWAGYQDELGRHISLAYLQIEAESF